ncbi:hypothetical protein SLEP1_g19519 [Rubroshorea leprosula]|uniref:non-specific serine/threonine protein kinase n=1 Tax=Rubroshorea leprosula TaxID=152421 RepID=A0AAV5J5I5_9ROSI|nr:hypothetical protein SLEP1_g19519 [Rubroshorea leprosula]
MESLVNGVSSSFKNLNSAPVIGTNHPSTSGTPRPARHPSPKPSRNEGLSSTSSANSHNHGVKMVHNPNGFTQKHPQKTANGNMRHEELSNVEKQYYASNKGKSEFLSLSKDLKTTAEILGKKDSMVETKSNIEHPVHDFESCISTVLMESESSASGLCKGGVGQLKNGITSQLERTFCPSPSNSLCTATLYSEAKESFTHTEVSECGSSVDKSGDSGEVSNSCDFIESRKTSIHRGSTGSDVSDESSSSSLSTLYKPHKANDIRWEAIRAVKSQLGAVELKHFTLLRRLGCGDIGYVYLSELAGTKTYFAMKVMDKANLVSRKKLLRAQIEREILQSLDHPFLPTLYTHFETEKFSCLVMEFCPGGDLHALRQRQPGKYFPEHAARFYVAEVLLALEYLHMLGIIYRDLKPENVLVREDGHIMLSDFDLSLRCAVSPTLVKSANSCLQSKSSGYCVQPACIMQPDCIQPMCFGPRFLSSKPKKEKKSKVKNETNHQVSPLPELIAEPTNARSMSFVGTHEYLAPEIIKGEGHGSAVDWWTFGIFLYELLFGKTPFKGAGNRATLFNVVGQPLKFPERPTVSFAAKDLIRGLLVKEPQHRLAYRRGATEIKQHPFFQSVNWALIRCTNPPEVPKQVMMDIAARTEMDKVPSSDEVPGVDVKPSGNYYEIDFF